MSDDSSFLRTSIPTIAGMAGAMGARSAISKAYASRRGTEPPVDPGAKDASWSSAITWTAIMAAGAAVGRLVARYVAGEQVDKHFAGQRELEKA
ncbi:DUF4235 domain-containing protein [Euzebya rosea]|uniref:DUF4235 domain-containing protein n=1 Tax=Euzebya rosea TaxID=2052804 RepID=UPI000D3EBB02|nr:DUF4235 domain-containing protein [Euzebya rosea]